MKICNTCKLEKTLSEYHRDSKGKQGRSASCGKCRNERKRKIKIEADIDKSIEIGSHIFKDVGDAAEYIRAKRTGYNVYECEAKDLLTLSEVSAKYNAHYNLSVSKTGRSVLQIHSIPSIGFKAESPELVLQKALDYQS